MSRKIIDLSHTIHHQMITYKGLPGPSIGDYLSREQSRGKYAPGTEFQIGKIEMVANTGTYVDSPFHRYADGADLSQLELEALADLEAVVIRRGVDWPRGVEPKEFQNRNIDRKAVLIHTGWDKLWRTEEYSSGKHPYLTAAAAELLATSGVKLVGIDSFNIDDTQGGERPVHSILLRYGIPIVEHMCGLQDVPDAGFRFFAVPVKIKGFGSFPVRAFALVG